MPALTFLLQQLYFNSYQQMEFQFSHPRQNPAPTAAQSWEAGSNRGMSLLFITSFSTGLATTLAPCPWVRPALPNVPNAPECGPGSSSVGQEHGSSTGDRNMAAALGQAPGSSTGDRLSPRPRHDQRTPAHSHQKGNSNLPTFKISFKILFNFFFQSNFCSRRNPQACL